MLVSIVTIFRNEERFLPEAVQSVLAQTFEEWEYLLVDDGSDDGSTGFARQLAERCRNVRYLDHPGHSHRGTGASRNRGLREARGDLVALLDADDVWAPEKLKRQIEYFDADPALAMLYGAPLYWYGWIGTEQAAARDTLQDIAGFPGEVFDPPALVTRFLRDSAATPCTCDLIVRRHVAEEVGGFEDEFFGLNEDQAFCLKVALHGRIGIGPRGLSRYRQHDASLCAQAFRSDAIPQRERARLLSWFEARLATSRHFDPELATALVEELRLVEGA
jgi:glycosyltransferase involved in cell wall biosynthesis